MPRRRLRDLSIVQNTPNSKVTNSEQQTAIGSSNVLETPKEPAEIQTESGGSRRTRGRTLLKDLYELNPAEHVKVSRNNLGSLFVTPSTRDRCRSRTRGVNGLNSFTYTVHFKISRQAG
ncbi:hypothetical protein V6Z12_A06G096800 [Gossypium hirsutum]